MREILIKARIAKNLKQKDIAEELNITQQFVSLIESGKRDPSLQLAKEFEILYQIPMEELFSDIFLSIQTTECNVHNKQSA